MKITKNLVVAFLIFPFNVMGVIPGAIVWFDAKIFVLSWFSLIIGGVLIGVGVVVIYKTVSLFTSYGNGTPAPYDPPTKFVIHGLYRYVRNPMMIGVFSVLIGEAIFFKSYLIFGWGLFFMIANLIYVPLWEETELADRFGDSYLEYTKHVPRWFPMKSPWNF